MTRQERMTAELENGDPATRQTRLAELNEAQWEIVAKRNAILDAMIEEQRETR
jgi:hypothetical protein